MDQEIKQKMFDTVVRHLRTQGERAISSNGIACAYRSCRDGVVLKCAVGCLISDEVYDPDIEGGTASNTEVLNLVRKSGWPIAWDDYKTHNLLLRLQRVHDLIVPDYWPEELAKLAAQYSLTFDWNV